MNHGPEWRREAGKTGRERFKESGVEMIDGEREEKGHGGRRDGWRKGERREGKNLLKSLEMIEIN